MSFNDKHPNHQRSLSMSTLEKKKVITSKDKINFNDDIVPVKQHNNSLIEISNNEGVLIETSREDEDKIQNISHLSDSIFEGSDATNRNNTNQHNQDRVVNISTISFDNIDNNNNQQSNLYNHNEDDVSTTNDNRVVNTEYKLNPRKKKNNIYKHPHAKENKMSNNDNDNSCNDIQSNSMRRNKLMFYYITFLILLAIIISLIVIIKIKYSR